MGSTCSACEGDSMQQATPDMADKRLLSSTQRTETKEDGLSSASDDEFQPTLINTDDKEEEEEEQSTKNVTYDAKQTERYLEMFREAIEKGNDSLVMYYLDEAEYASLHFLDATFQNGDNCLHVAVQHQRHSLIPNQQNETNGDTPLHTAVRVGDLKIVTLLLQFNADGNIENNQQQTAISLAMETNQEDIAELLMPETQQIFTESIEALQNQKSKEFADSILTTNNISDEHHSVEHFDSLHATNTARLDQHVGDVLVDEHGESLLLPSTSMNGVDSVSVTAMDSMHLEKAATDILSEDDDGEELKLKTPVIHAAKPNPFKNLKRQNTKQALNKMTELEKQKQLLPLMETWMERKQNSMPYAWLKRFAAVSGSHFLWSDKKLAVGDTKDRKERDKWNTAVHLMSIQEVKVVANDKKKRQFAVMVKQHKGKSKEKEYLWRASSENERDHWVNGLKQHIKFYKEMVSYLHPSDLHAMYRN